MAKIHTGLADLSLTIRHLLSSRENISAAYFAGAITLALHSPGIISLGMLAYVTCLLLGFYFAKCKPYWSKEIALCLVVCTSAFIAIPLSFLFQERNPAATALLAMLTLILFPLLFLENIKPIFYALIPAWFLQASVMAWQWFFEPEIMSIPWRAGGIAENENAGSAFLLIGGIFLITQRNRGLKWLSVPLLLAICLSGSRWVVVCAVLILGLIFIAKYVPWKWILVGSLLSFTAFFALQHVHMFEGFRIGTDQMADVEYRANAQEAEFSFWGIWLPRGFHDTNLHSLPLRMTDEGGLLSALAWGAVGLFTLLKTPRSSFTWWGMLAICLLSIMYYHVWIGPMGAFWWLFAARRL